MTGVLIMEKHAELMQQIKSLISAPPEIYKELYLNTFYRFAEFCQAMPCSEADELYSLLTKQLKLCITVLKIRRGILLPKSEGGEAIAQQESRWTYGIFSACLLYGLNKVQQDRRVDLYNAKGELINCWHPIIGSLYEPETYFCIQWNSQQINVLPYLMAALAIKIIPANAIKWLSQSALLLNQWWDALTNNNDNLISNIINEAIELSKNGTAVNTIEQFEEDKIAPFINSLIDKKYLDNGELAWMRFDQGVFVNINFINMYIAKNNIWKDAAALINDIKNFLIIRDEKYLIQYRPKNFEDKRIVEGVLIKEKYINISLKDQPVNTVFIPVIKL